MSEFEGWLPDNKEIADIFLPFMQKTMSVRDEFVRRQLGADARRFLIERGITAFRRITKGWRRRQEDVQKKYDSSWKTMEWSSLLPEYEKKYLLQWGDDYYLGNAKAIIRVHIACLAGIIDHLKPKRVLEVGSGRGTNLVLLAEKFEGVEFHGLDLAPSGVKLAQELDSQEKLPEELAQYAPFEIKACRTPGRLKLVQGSATEIPFPEGYFDFVYTRQALEQMELYRPRVFSEIHRVCRGYAAFFEAFRDWNESGVRRNRIVALDYFAARISDVSGYGFEPVLCRDDFPTKTYMNVGMVLAKRV